MSPFFPPTISFPPDADSDNDSDYDLWARLEW